MHEHPDAERASLAASRGPGGTEDRQRGATRGRNTADGERSGAAEDGGEYKVRGADQARTERDDADTS